MFVELHIIQNFAPSCLNRDESNNPKDCTFGGYRRARISSQCLKYTIRWHPIFQETVLQNPSLRGRFVKQWLAKRLSDEKGFDAVEINNVLEYFVYSILAKGKDKATNVPLLFGRDEIDRIVEKLTATWDELTSLMKTLNTEDDDARTKARNAIIAACANTAKDIPIGTSAVDIALFGRMVAEKSWLNEVDAACQVQHALSTHRVEMEDDFFTAVEEFKLSGDDEGAAMMDNSGFNCSCYYRYSTLDTKQLVNNLKKDIDLARRGIEGFLRASVAAIPNAKKGAYAQQVCPDFISVIVRDKGMPWSLVNAFQKPVSVPKYGSDGKSSLVDLSIERLDSYLGKLQEVYGDNGMIFQKAVTTSDMKLNNLNTSHTLNELINGAMEAIQL